jgi:N-acetylglucosamine kinase-like BadF-type ATPase
MIAGSGNLYAGFDLGGTKISMSIMDGSGDVLRRDKLKTPANISSASGMLVANEAITMIARSGYLPDIAAMTFAIAGYSDKGELYNFEHTIRREFSSIGELFFMPDYQIFFHADWPDFTIEEDRAPCRRAEETIKALIICGTGSIVLASTKNGPADNLIHRIFGGGPILSDPGSGFDLGLRFLRKYGIESALGTLDDRVPALAEKHGFAGAAAMAREARPGNPSAVSAIASFAPLMLEISETSGGGPYLKETLEASGNLALGASHIFKNNFKNYIDKPVQILFNGSVLLRSDFYKEIMKLNLKNLIGASNMEFFEVNEDVSLICARYSKSVSRGA